MPNWGVIPSIRVRDMRAALRCYRETMGFTVTRGRGGRGELFAGAGAMPTSCWRSPPAIRQRLGARSPLVLSIEAPDLEALSPQVQASGLVVADPMATRPWGQSEEFTVEDSEGNWLTFWKA